MNPQKQKSLEPIEDGPPMLDIDEHAADLHALGITEEAQAQELLQSLHHIMCTFVDLGWGVDIVQIMLPEIFGKIANDNNQLNNGGVNE